MPRLAYTVLSDEKSWQMNFYKTLFGSEIDTINIERGTDGYTKGILFEHKQNVTSYGKGKALSQALIYLARFNRDGIPVPAKICLVSQNEQKCYIYNSKDYLDYINNIEEYANLKASDGIPNFTAGVCIEEISFDLSSIISLQPLLQFVQQPPKVVKVNITKHNVYGWSTFYYDHALEYKQQPEKKEFFLELKNPQKTLKDYIEKWQGSETDFADIMDILNDPKTQKELGAFYTPLLYAKTASNLVEKAIKRAIDAGKKDYIILDRCAGTGNLEMFFDDEILSHVIINTYELKEWIVLKDRFGKRVRCIIPPIPCDKSSLPLLNEEGFLTGANALSENFLQIPEIQKHINNPDCAIILLENPPYVESIETTKNMEGKTVIQKTKSDWKKYFIPQEMKNSITGVALNDMGNVFIWSAFKYFLRQKSDSYIVFAPVKYWKSQHVISKKFIEGYAFNKKHFHASDSCIMCALWSNEEDIKCNEISLQAINIIENKPIDENTLSVKKVYSTFSDNYFDNRIFDNDVKNGFVCEINGTISNKTPVGITPITNSNILGYLVAYKNTFDNPRYCSMLLRFGAYNGHGFYLRKDNFLEKLPLFAASRYTDNDNNWKVMSMIMKSGDKAEAYINDVKKGNLSNFLFKTFFWTCLSHYAHLRSLTDTNGNIYYNELCFDNGTYAQEKFNEFIHNGYKLTEKELSIIEKWNTILSIAKKADEYNPKYKYGLYQIDEEINIKIQSGFDAKGNPKNIPKYGDLNNTIKEFKLIMREYYLTQLVDTLFKYEFLK